MIYCVSDIHGELDKFERLLSLIQFSENDHLYVIGDAIDRCAMGVDILRPVMDTPNMTMLLGNHEQMCLATPDPHRDPHAEMRGKGKRGADGISVRSSFIGALRRGNKPPVLLGEEK